MRLRLVVLSLVLALVTLCTAQVEATNPVAPKLLLSTDTGAPTISGTAGDLLSLLDQTLIINRQFTAISGASFVNNSTAARLQGSTAWKLFQGPTATNDEAYFGFQAKFEQIVFTFGTAGVQNTTITLSWQYWNGSAWTAFTPDSDGTAGLTASGTVKWTISNLTSWATTSVNSVSLFYVRLRFTAGSWTTNPLVTTSSLLGWTRAFSGTNQAVYQQGAGNSRYLEINDAAPTTAKEARVRAYETCPTWTSYGSNTCTGPFPTSSQFTNGEFIRKSNTADATTRAWKLWADDRTFYLFVLTADLTNTYVSFGFGDFYTYVSSDSYRTFIAGRQTENTTTGGTNDSLFWCESAISTATLTGFNLDRDYQGSVAGSYKGAHHSHAATQTAGNFTCAGGIQYVNGADGNIYAERLFIHEATTSTIRGYMRGMLAFLHAASNASDGDSVTGLSGAAFSGRTYAAIKYVCTGNSSACASNAGMVVLLETSNTVDTN